MIISKTWSYVVRYLSSIWNQTLHLFSKFIHTEWSPEVRLTYTSRIRTLHSSRLTPKKCRYHKVLVIKGQTERSFETHRSLDWIRSSPSIKKSSVYKTITFHLIDCYLVPSSDGILIQSFVTFRENRRFWPCPPTPDGNRTVGRTGSDCVRVL